MGDAAGIDAGADGAERNAVVSRLADGLGLGFGTAQFGNLGRQTDQRTSDAAVAEAWAAGVRYFDTAPHYGLGLAERRLGLALRGIPRDEVILSTKVGRLLVPSPETAGERDPGFLVPASSRRVWDFSRDGVLASVEASLRRLRTDHVEIAYLHDPDHHWEAASTTGIEALRELRDQGVVGAIGAAMNQAAMLTEFVRRCDVDIVMVAGRLTLLDRSAAEELVPAATERGVAIVAAAVYNSGVLATDLPAADATFDYAQASTLVLDRARQIAAICRANGVSLPDAAVAFPRRFPSVVSTVVGMRTAEHVRENLRRWNVAIPVDLWGDLESIDDTDSAEGVSARS